MAKIKGGKGGSSKPRTPVEQRDNLLSTAKAKILLALGEGEFAGEVNARNIFLDGTPLENDDGSSNFEGVKFEFRSGTQSQDYIQGMPSSENEITVGNEIKSGSPWTRTITNTQLSAIRLRLKFPSLFKQEDNGDLNGYVVKYKIELQTNGGRWEVAVDDDALGKSTAGYEKSHRINLPQDGKVWNVRVTKITPDANSAKIGDKMVIESFAEVIDAKLRYPHTALLYIEFDSSQFGGSIPQISCEPKGRVIRVPSNYNPETRIYSGVWDGSFKWAWTDNPAWIFYDINIEDRFGLGDRIKPFNIDKWTLYEISQYCDQLVPDGKGGDELEPRYICNIYVQDRNDAFAVLRDFAAIFRGMTYWGGDQLVALADMPRDVDYAYTAANVIDGKFVYSNSGSKSRYTTALVSYSDPDNAYSDAMEPVFEHDLVSRHGFNQLEITAIGCTRQSEANRKGRWGILTNSKDRMVSFSVGLDGNIPQPGYIVSVADELISGRIMGGRISSVSGRVLTLDRKPNAKEGDRLVINLPSGKSQSRTIQAINDNKVTVTTEYKETPQAELVWVIDADELYAQQYRVIGITENDDGSFSITGAQHDPDKYARIDTGAMIEQRPISVVPPSVQGTPKDVVISSYSSVNQGISVETLLCQWEPTDNAISYESQWRRNDGNWVNVPRSSVTSFEIQGVYTGRYQVRVRAINASEISSGWAYSQETALTGKQGNPPKPLNLRATTEIWGITLDWGFAANTSDTLKTELQYSSESTPDSMQLLADVPYPLKSYRMSGLKAGIRFYFRARLVDKTGNQSPWSDIILGESSADTQAILDAVGDKFLSTETGKEMQKDIDFSRDKVDALEIEQQETSQKVIDIDSKTVELDNRVVQINTDVGIANEAILQNTLFTTQLSYKISEEKADRKAEIFELKQVQVTDREAFARWQTQTSAVIASNTSSILAVKEAQATYEEASAKQINQVKADVEGVTGRVTEVESATATLTEAQAKFERSTVAQFEEHMGYITRIETAVSNDLFSLSESVMQTAAQFTSQSDKQLKSEARITKNEKAVATETEARAVMGVQIDARLNDTESAITDIKEVQSEQDKALAKTTEQLRAEIKIGDDKLQENIDEKGRELSKVSSSIDEQKIAIAELDKTQTEIKQTQQSQYKDTQASIADLKQTQASDNAVLSESILQNTASINQQGAELTKTNAEVKRISTATANNEKSTAALAESVKTQFEDSEAAFVDVRKSVAEVDKAQSERTEQVRAELGKGITDNKGEIDKTKGDLANVSAAVTSNAKAIAATDKTLTEKIEQAASRFEDNEASISNIQQSQSNIESSQAETSMQITAQQNKLNSELLHAKASITETNKVVADNHQAFVQKGVQLDAQFENVNSRLVRVDSAIADNEKALTQTQEQLRAEFKSDFDDTNSLINENKSAIAETNKSIAKVDRDLNARVGKAEGSIGETQKAVADNERALADFSQLTKAEFDNQQAAIEQRAQTVFDHQGNGSAMYKIQAGIHWNGQYHDAKFIIGAEVKNGQVTTQIGFSADTFGILNPSSGKLEPVFFVENGQVFINEAFINQATIEKLLIGSTIKSKHWDPVTKKGLMLDFESGKIIASDAEITGEINATSGTFSNVTIDENCDVKGTIYANKIVGDVIRVHSIPFDGSITLPAEAFDRTLVIPALTVSTMESADFMNITWHVEVKINDRIIISFSPLSSVTGSRSAGGDKYDVYAITSGSTSGAGVLYANETATISYKIVGHVSSYKLIHKIPAQCLVFKS
ncbi:TipJ family phage tail tip protein [Moellerella wisconsensis]|uniref:TipJ family phage tail tip protein n=4 Tax=Moellerella wisconsensis TaxID=158849 RepID=UPI003B97F47F